MKRGIIFLSGFLGREILKCLAKTKLRPFIAVYPTGGHRRREEFDFTAYSHIFSIITINAEKYSSLQDQNILPNADYIFTVDWTKDFFHSETSFPFKVYHAHPSLLPLYRGYGAVSEQFLRGVCVSGLTVYEENGLVDAGDIIFQEQIRIALEDTPESFLKKCAGIAVDFIAKLEVGDVHRSYPQNALQSFYIPRTRNKQKNIDFNASAYCVHNFIRAFSYPFPYASFFYRGEQYKATISAIESWSGVEGEPGRILKISPNGLEVACGEGSVLIKKVMINGTTCHMEEGIFIEGEFLV